MGLCASLELYHTWSDLLFFFAGEAFFFNPPERRPELWSSAPRLRTLVSSRHDSDSGTKAESAKVTRLRDLTLLLLARTSTAGDNESETSLSESEEKQLTSTSGSCDGGTTHKSDTLAIPNNFLSVPWLRTRYRGTTNPPWRTDARGTTNSGTETATDAESFLFAPFLVTPGDNPTV